MERVVIGGKKDNGENAYLPKLGLVRLTIPRRCIPRLAMDVIAMIHGGSDRRKK